MRCAAHTCHVAAPDIWCAQHGHWNVAPRTRCATHAYQNAAQGIRCATQGCQNVTPGTCCVAHWYQNAAQGMRCVAHRCRIAAQWAQILANGMHKVLKMNEIVKIAAKKCGLGMAGYGC